MEWRVGYLVVVVGRLRGGAVTSLLQAVVSRSRQGVVPYVVGSPNGGIDAKHLYLTDVDARPHEHVVGYTLNHLLHLIII